MSGQWQPSQRTTVIIALVSVVALTSAGMLFMELRRQRAENVQQETPEPR